MEPGVHYRLHNCPSLAPILRQMDPVHVLAAFHFLEATYVNLVLPSTPTSTKLNLTFTFPGHNWHAFYSHIHAICPAHLILLNLINRVTFG